MSESGTFSVMRVRREGRDGIVVVDTALSGTPQTDLFPHLVRVALPIRRANHLGLCDEVESERLADVEDRLLGRLDESAYRYAGRVTWNGTREVLLYVANPTAVLARLHATARELQPEQSVELSTELEPSWDTYMSLLNALNQIASS
jgi:hypothetical protein